MTCNFSKRTTHSEKISAKYKISASKLYRGKNKSGKTEYYMITVKENKAEETNNKSQSSFIYAVHEY
jgi:hypothetical protein